MVRVQCTKGYARIALAILVLLAVGGAIIGVIVHVNNYMSSFPLRVNCNPESVSDYKRCLKRGCKWVSTEDDDKKTPPCFYPEGYGYRWKEEQNQTQNGFVVDLHRTVDNVIYGAEVNRIRFQLFHETTQRLRLKITDPNNTRYEVPTPVPDPPAKSPPSPMYKVELENIPQFGIKIIRISNNVTIFDTNVPGLIFSDQFLQISTKLPSKNVYGLGEHRTVNYKHSTDWKKWTFFARDEGPLEDKNLYGVHPFYMVVEENGDTHGVFLHNSNAMEVELQPYPALTFRTIGGILDLYVFLGPTPEDVVKQYLEVIGKPAFPPYWGLGFQMSRWGYHDLATFNKTITRNINSNIPLDVMYLDLDYAKDKMMFTYDDKNFEELPEFVRSLHQQNRKLVILLDPAIPCNETTTDGYQPLKRGKDLDVFIKMNGSYLQGQVWPGLTHFPDFTHKNAKAYWSTECEDFHKTIEYDGLWVDMNEPASFLPGSVNGCQKNNLNYPPFTAGVADTENMGRLFEKTICMDATQELGVHYNLHSLYGHFHALTTHQALTSMFPSKRPFIIGRSTYAGTSKYAGHWLGDNRSRWSQLQESIPGVMEFNIFGFPLVGADICGFFENTTEELCLRWMQVGAFYTFSRNHNGIDFIEQDPAALGERVVNASVQALQSRYLLLPYLYTLFYKAHVDGGTVIRPLLHEFPKDKNTWDINYQFLWGPSLLISPAVFEKQETVDAYFPEGVWYDFYTGAITKSDGPGEYRKLEASMSKVNLHIRGGAILPLQDPGSNTVDSRKNGMQLRIAPDANGRGKGSLYWDDGETSDITNPNQFLLLEFLYQKESGGLRSSIIMENTHNYTTDVVFKEITVYNQPTLSGVSLNGKKIDYDYDHDLKTLTLKNQNLKLTESFEITIEYKNS